MDQTNVTKNAGPTTIFVIRHAEKPGQYGAAEYKGVNPPATACGAAATEDLTTLGWQRAGGLVTLFGPPPFGPRKDLAAPDHLYAANPQEKKSGKTPMAGAITLTRTRKNHASKGTFLPCWKRGHFHFALTRPFCRLTRNPPIDKVTGATVMEE